LKTFAKNIKMGDTTKTPGSLEETTQATRAVTRQEMARVHAERAAKQKELSGYLAWSIANGVEPFDVAVDDLVSAAQRKLSPGDVIEVRATEYWNDHRSSKSRGELNGEAVFRYRVQGDGNGGLSAMLEGEAPPQYPHFVGDIVPGVETTPDDDGNYVHCTVRLAVTRKVEKVEKKAVENDGGEAGDKNLTSLGAMLVGGADLPSGYEK
jgi:hypothetical protein